MSDAHPPPPPPPPATPQPTPTPASAPAPAPAPAPATTAASNPYVQRGSLRDTRRIEGAQILEEDLTNMDLGADLARFEEIYMKECMKARPNPTAKFNYAWALIRNRERSSIKKGVIMMSGLLEDRYNERDCLYYMALGYYRLDDVVQSRKCLEKLLRIAPNCRQAISLMDIVEDKITKDGFIGLSIVSGVVALAGMIAAIGIKASSSRS